MFQWKELKEDTLMGTKLKCVFEKVDEHSKSNDANNEPTNETDAAVTANTQYASLEEKNKRIGDSVSIKTGCEKGIQLFITPFSSNDFC